MNALVKGFYLISRSNNLFTFTGFSKCSIKYIDKQHEQSDKITLSHHKNSLFFSVPHQKAPPIDKIRHILKKLNQTKKCAILTQNPSPFQSPFLYVEDTEAALTVKTGLSQDGCIMMRTITY